MYSLPNFVAFSVVKNAETVCFYTWIFFIFFIQIVCGFSHVLWCYFIHSIWIFIYLTMGLHSLNAIFHQITRVLYFYLCQYYVTCIMFLNSLQFENELKKVGTFVHLTFVFVCELSNFFGITFHISIFSFVLLFYVFVLWRILSMTFKQVLALLWQMLKKKQKIFSNKVKVIYSKSNITKIVSKVLGCFFLFFKLCYSNLPTFLSIK